MENNEVGFVYSDPIETIRRLTLDLIAQLQPDIAIEKLANSISRNLICIAEILQFVEWDAEWKEKDSEDTSQHFLSLFWLMRRVQKAINYEITRAPKSICVVRYTSFSYC